LPITVKDRLGKASHEICESKLQEEIFTLTRKVIPIELCWMEKAKNSCPEENNVTVQDTILRLAGHEFWIWGETSCDVELDTTGK
jgi:hypothetical protein